MSRVLWLASWYPSAIEPYNGDFVQRHAEAVSLYQDVDVIHVIKDPAGSLTKSVLVDVQRRGRLTEHRVYYHSPFRHLPLLGRLFSEIAYRRVFKRQLVQYMTAHGKPGLVHLHVCMKAGPLARWLKKKYKLPFVVTEHSSQYYKEDANAIDNANPYYRYQCRRTLQEASAISVVSHHLGRAIQAFCGKAYTVIPNVVNTTIFQPVKKEGNASHRFLHVSGLGAHKGISTILAAFAAAIKTVPDLVLHLVGPDSNNLQQTIAALGLKNVVHVHPEMPQKNLAHVYQQVGAVILFSHYETFGCVLIEANAAGTPVLVNDIPVMRENVTHDATGLLVPNNAADLAKTIVAFASGKYRFDPEVLHQLAKEKYGYAVVGKQFAAFYQDRG